MCEACNDTGVIHIVEGSMALITPCLCSKGDKNERMMANDE